METLLKKQFEDMTLAELQGELDRMQNSLDDLIATFNFNLANTPDHHNEAVLREHEDEIGEYRHEIETLERLITNMKDSSK